MTEYLTLLPEYLRSAQALFAVDSMQRAEERQLALLESKLSRLRHAKRRLGPAVKNSSENAAAENTSCDETTEAFRVFDATHAKLIQAYQRFANELEAAKDDFRCRTQGELERVISRYQASLTPVRIAECPICGAPFERSIDLTGLDGLFWWALDYENVPPPCTHFLLTRGAVSFRERPIRAGMPVCTGPESPYVVPSLLADERTIMLLQHADMVPGYRVFFMTYYTPHPQLPPGAARYWPDPVAAHRPDIVLPGMERSSVPWDFDLAYWIHTKRIRYRHVGAWMENERDFAGSVYSICSAERKLIVANDAVQSTELPWGL